MRKSWLCFVLAFSAGVCNAFQHGMADWQTPILVTKPLHPPGYNRSLAMTMMRYSVASYREKTYLSTWSCDVCRKLMSFNLRAVVSDEKDELRVIVGYASDLRAIVVAFRGTANVKNWEEDFLAWHTKASVFGKNGGQVHDGFYKAYMVLRHDLMKELEGMLSDHSAFRRARILVTGHSLGGALATLCVLDLRDRHPERELTTYTFGSPRVGDSQFATLYASKIPRSESFRVVNSGDPVTKVPPAFLGYRHVPTMIVASSSSAHRTYLGISTKLKQRSASSAPAEESSSPRARVHWIED